MYEKYKRLKHESTPFKKDGSYSVVGHTSINSGTFGCIIYLE